jgi:hypothetical protein
MTECAEMPRESQAVLDVENCGNTLIRRCSARERGGTSEFASRLIGKREVIRRQISHNRAGGFLSRAHATQTFSEQHVTEEAVMASEIEQLPDLTGFLKVSFVPRMAARYRGAQLTSPSSSRSHCRRVGCVGLPRTDGPGCSNTHLYSSSKSARTAGKWLTR